MTGSRGEALRGRRRGRSDRAAERLDWADRHLSGILSLFNRGNLDTFWIRSGYELDAIWMRSGYGLEGASMQIGKGLATDGMWIQ